MLKFIGQDMNFRGKLLLANAFMISRIIYLLPLCGGTSAKYTKKVQIMMNMTARWVTGSGRRTRSLKLMKACKWLNLNELTKLHSLITMWKIVRYNTPRNLSLKVDLDANNFISTSIPRLRCTEDNFRHRTTQLWNTLPAEVRGISQLPRFKSSV